MVEAVRRISPKNMQMLEGMLDSVSSKQGIIGRSWNGIKEIFNIGQSERDCEKMLEKYENGSVSFEEAVEYIEDFERKQTDATGLITNIATGVGSIALATVAVGSGPIGWTMAAVKGAPIGAAIKAGLGTLDRATNEIEGDALDAKTIAKDAINGAVTGTTSAISSGVGAGIKAGNFGLTVKNGVKCGLECGALSGALGYMTDVAFDDEEFSVGDLAKNTITSSLVSGSVGAVVGTGMYGISSAAGTVGKEVTKTTTQTIIQDSTSSSARKVLAKAERTAAGVLIGSVAANSTNKEQAA